jgi:hypothetical protein
MVAEMSTIGKSFALILILLMAISSASLLIVKPTNAQTLPTPSIPQFSLKFVDSSYDVPTSVTTDPFTGQNTTMQGYHVQQSTLEIIIVNQQLVYQSKEYPGASFYYNVNFKGQFDSSWRRWFFPDNMPLANASGPQTIITMGTLSGNSLNVSSGSQPTEIDVPSNGTIDFQVQALIGQVGKVAQSLGGWEFDGQTSGWSTTQTITIPASSTSSTPTPTIPNSGPTSSPTLTPTVPEFSWLAILPLLASMFAVALFVKQRNVKKLWLK